MAGEQLPAQRERQMEHEAAAERRRNSMRGNTAMALMHLANAQKDLANAIRISPMRGVTPAVDAGLAHALEEIGKARTKINTAIAEAQGVAMLEDTLRAAGETP